MNLSTGAVSKMDNYRLNNLDITLDREGAIYLSPLNTSRDNRRLLRTFVEIKNLSRLPTYLYLIQRL